MLSPIFNSLATSGTDFPGLTSSTACYLNTEVYLFLVDRFIAFTFL
jgi:hypothetical protein